MNLLTMKSLTGHVDHNSHKDGLLNGGLTSNASNVRDGDTKLQTVRHRLPAEKELGKDRIHIMTNGNPARNHDGREKTDKLEKLSSPDDLPGACLLASNKSFILIAGYYIESHFDCKTSVSTQCYQCTVNAVTLYMLSP